jgi:TRAP transporter TAXI family solute receptor
MKLAALLAHLALAALIGLTAQAHAQPRSYVFATGPTGSAEHPLGAAIATLPTLAQEPPAQAALSAAASSGSGENLRRLQANTAQFAILESSDGAAASADGNLRAVMRLWPSVAHLAVRREFAATGTAADLRSIQGQRLSFGAPPARALLESLGVANPGAAYDLVELGPEAAGKALRDGEIAGFWLSGGRPHPVLVQLLGTMSDEIALLEVPRPGPDNGPLASWSPYRIQPGTYPNQTDRRDTLAQPLFLAVRADVPADDVQAITRMIYANREFLEGVHPAAEGLSLSTALAGLPLPLHPGALRHFQEQGLTIPERLVPPPFVEAAPPSPAAPDEEAAPEQPASSASDTSTPPPPAAAAPARTDAESPPLPPARP